MIFSDSDIRRALAGKRIVIEPLEADAQVQPASVDLRLSDEFRVFRHSERAFIDPRNNDGNFTELIRVEDGKPFIVHPGEFVLGSTIENVELPLDIMGRLDGRSSLGRVGLVIHSTAGNVEPGWRGRLTLEISNTGKMPVAIYPGMRICTISFNQMASPSSHAKHSKGDKYSGQKQPQESKISIDG
jgi:dCTP deaminase